VILTLTPATGATLGIVGTECQALGDTHQSCQVTMTGDVSVNVTFNPQTNTVALTITGGAAGNGGVT
jgi:hypothetical protein